MEILAKEMCICVQKESVSKSLTRTSQERGAVRGWMSATIASRQGMETIRSGV